MPYDIAFACYNANGRSIIAANYSYVLWQAAPSPPTGSSLAVLNPWTLQFNFTAPLYAGLGGPASQPWVPSYGLLVCEVHLWDSLASRNLWSLSTLLTPGAWASLLLSSPQAWWTKSLNPLAVNLTCINTAQGAVTAVSNAIALPPGPLTPAIQCLIAEDCGAFTVFYRNGTTALQPTILDGAQWSPNAWGGAGCTVDFSATTFTASFGSCTTLNQ